MRTTIIKVAIGATAVFALTAGPALADIQPQSGDIVGVGSDTVQNIMNFVADGDNQGDVGYNTSATKNRVFNFNATPDENDRAGYLNGSTSASLLPLNPTIVFRAGGSPIQRPNGSGAGITALLADTTKPYKITYVRASRPPKAAELTTASNDGFGGLHTVKISDDALSIAVNGQTTPDSSGTCSDNTTGAYCATYSSNAPAGLSVAQLKSIYQCTATTWNQVGGTSSNVIIPLIPQSGSGTRSTFLSDIGVTTLGSCVQTVEENDPTSIANATQPGSTTKDPSDAIAPFSGGRIDLYANGYFTNPATAFPGGAALTPNVALLGADAPTTASDNSANYLDNRGLYIIFRANDGLSTNTTKIQPGSSLNYAQALFIGKAAVPASGSTPAQPAVTPYVNTGGAQADIAAAGATPDYADMGTSFSQG